MDNLTPVPEADLPQASPSSMTPVPAEDIPKDYSTPTQQAIAGVEGVAHGVLGPLATVVERKMMHIPAEEIRGREEANPMTSGIGEAAGLLSPVGEGAALVNIGEHAAAAATEAGARKLALKAAEKTGDQAAIQAAKAATDSATYLSRVGSTAVQQAAEMAVLQSGNEANKMLLQDPDASAQSAIANIGLSAALGGGAGAFVTGAISPLWKATVGPKLESSLKSIQDHMNGGALVPEEMEKASKELGVEIPELIRGANTSPESTLRYNNLKRLETSEIKEAESKFHQSVADSVASALGKPVEDFHNYETSTAGREGMEAFKKEVKAKVEPISDKFNSLTKPFRETPVQQSDMSELAENISRKALEKGYVGMDVPQQKIIDAAITRLPRIKTAEDLKRLVTVIGNISRENPAALSRASHDIIGEIMNSQQQILGAAIKDKSPQLFDTYVQARSEYNSLANNLREMGSHLGIGRFEGPETFLKTVESKRSPEEFLRRLSPAGNAELLPFMEKNFPTTLSHIKDNELKKIVAPAVRAAKGDHPINVTTLQNAISKRLSGQEAVTRWALPPDLIRRAEAAERVKMAIPGIKDSGTPGGLLNNLRKVPAAAMGMIAAITGHNPFLGAVFGHVGQMLSRNVPDAIDMAMLRFAASGEPINAAGFKSMVDFVHNAQQGFKAVSNATGGVFKPGAQVLLERNMPDKADREKLDGQVTKYQNDPQKAFALTNAQTGHYLPQHQSSLTAGAVGQLNYLKNLKPQPERSGPLDTEHPPAPDKVARYNRALDIANSPISVLQRVKDGSVQLSDLQDLKALYPGLYPVMAQQLSNQMTNRTADNGAIPYKTKVGLSLFLGQSLDTSMSPASILAAQPQPKTPQQAQANKGTKRGTSTLGKSNSQYLTPNQASEKGRQED